MTSIFAGKGFRPASGGEMANALNVAIAQSELRNWPAIATTLRECRELWSALTALLPVKDARTQFLASIGDAIEDSTGDSRTAYQIAELSAFRSATVPRR